MYRNWGTGPKGSHLGGSLEVYEVQSLLWWFRRVQCYKKVRDLVRTKPIRAHEENQLTPSSSAVDLETPHKFVTPDL